jgi:hypothetical protein
VQRAVTRIIRESQAIFGYHKKLLWKAVLEGVRFHIETAVSKSTLRGTMGNRSRMSHAATVNYVGEMATELARMAGEVQCTKLAYILEVAALEARTTIQPSVDVHCGAGGLH